MDLLTEFRRELMKSLDKIQADDFLTKKEASNLINQSYARAKQRCTDDEVSLADE